MGRGKYAEALDTLEELIGNLNEGCELQWFPGAVSLDEDEFLSKLTLGLRPKRSSFPALLTLGRLCQAADDGKLDSFLAEAIAPFVRVE